MIFTSVYPFSRYLSILFICILVIIQSISFDFAAAKTNNDGKSTTSGEVDSNAELVDKVLSLARRNNKRGSDYKQGLELRRGEDVVALISPVWDQLVAKHQDGLLDPKQKSSAVSAVLSPKEAMYHYNAALDGIVDSARFLLTFGVAASVAEFGGLGEDADPLASAIIRNDAKEVEGLLDLANGVDPNSLLLGGESSFEITPLHLAIAVSKKNDSHVVDLLLKNGADPSIRAKHGATPLMVAAALNRPLIAQSLFRHGARADEAHSFAGTTPVHFAAEMGHEDVLRVLCAWLKDHNIETDRLRSGTGGTPLHTASDSNRPNVLPLLVKECGCDVNALLNGDSTSLYLASQRGFVEVIQTLAKLNANLDFIMPQYSEFARERAVRSRKGLISVENNNNIDIKESGAYDHLNKNTEIGNGATALHAASENGHLEAVDALLKLGAKQTDSMQGASPLLIAIQYRHPEIALRLLENATGDSVKINSQATTDGSFALFSASGMGMAPVVRAILGLKGVNVNLKNNMGASALSHAIYRGHLSIAQILLQAGARFDSYVCQAGLERMDSNNNKHWMEFMDQSLEKWMLAEPNGPSISACLQIMVNKPNLGTRIKRLIKKWLENPSIRHKINPTELDKEDGTTSLLLSSARNGHVELMDSLVNLAREKQQLATTVEVLLNQHRAGKKLSQATMLYLAASENQVEMVEWLLSTGANYHLGVIVEEESTLKTREIPPMIVACEKGFDKVVALLVKKGDSVDNPVALNSNNRMVTGMTMAVMHSQPSIIKRFANDENAREAFETAIDHAPSASTVLESIFEATNLLNQLNSTTRNRALVRLLLRQSESKHARPHSDCLSSVKMVKRGWSKAPMDGTLTPLHAAVIAYADEEDKPAEAEKKASELIRELIQGEEPQLINQILFRKTTNTGFTPLALAVEAERVEIVKMLLKQISDEPTRNRLLRVNSANGETPLEASRRLRNPKLISFLGTMLGTSPDLDPENDEL